MRYGSICSGIEAASAAWEPLGWTPAFFAEIDAFPQHVLHHRFGSNVIARSRRRSSLPRAPGGIWNFGDFTGVRPNWTRRLDGDPGTIDLLVGGTPCQDFSVAGKRAGLDGDRGGLTLEFAKLARRLRSRWFLWENVPGSLSLNGGRDFGAVIATFAGFPDGFVFEPPAKGWGTFGIAEPNAAAGVPAWGVAWRVLDAQYVRVDSHPRAVPQRRERVFVVGYLGDWRPAASVLFEPEGLRRDSPPRRKAGQGVAGTIGASLARCSADEGERGTMIPEVAFGGNNTSGAIGVAPALRAKGGSGHGDFESEAFLLRETAPALDASFGRLQGQSGQDASHGHGHLVPISRAVAHPRRGDGFDASEDGTGRGTPIIPIAFHARQDPCPAEVCGALDSDGSSRAVACDLRGREDGSQMEGPHETANLRAASGGSSRSYVAASTVRRLTPRECERLQGFADDFTAVPYRGKPARECPDGPRYKALGNSMAVNCMRWLGERIDVCDRVLRAEGRK